MIDTDSFLNNCIVVSHDENRNKIGTVKNKVLMKHIPVLNDFSSISIHVSYFIKWSKIILLHFVTYFDIFII